MNTPTRPLALEIDDAMRELTASVEQIAARHGLPCYLMELLVSDILARLQNGKRTELENARRSYEQSLAERSKENDERNCDNS